MDEPIPNSEMFLIVFKVKKLLKASNCRLGHDYIATLNNKVFLMIKESIRKLQKDTKDRRTVYMGDLD